MKWLIIILVILFAIKLLFGISIDIINRSIIIHYWVGKNRKFKVINL